MMPFDTVPEPPEQSATLYVSPWNDVPPGKYVLHEPGFGGDLEIRYVTVERTQHDELYVVYENGFGVSPRLSHSIHGLHRRAVLKPRE